VAVRTGRQYVDRLRDDRRVFANGALVRDVTQHRPFQGIIRTLADLYDRHHDPAARDVLTFRSPTSGDRVSTSFLPAKTWAEMEQRAAGERARAEATYGSMGRLPDFMNAMLTDASTIRPLLASREKAFGANLVAYYEKVREEDLCLTHALADPLIDRSKGIDEQEALRIVKETDAGLVVRGARMLSTLAPVAHEIWIGPYMPRRPGEEDYTLCFALPMATPGLTFLCRESYDAGRSAYDRPLSGRFDEGDAIAVFADVLVPWERVFIARDVEIANAFLPSLPGYVSLQAVIRGATKLRFLTGLACLVADTVGRSSIPRYQEMIGELVGFVEMADGFVTAAAHDALFNAQRLLGRDASDAIATPLSGTGRSALSAAGSIRLFFPEAITKAVHTLRLLGSSGLVMTPAEADFASPEAHEILQRYLRGREITASERVRVMKLAWDAIATEFAGRQMLYEWFYAGDPVTNRMGFYMAPRREECAALARSLLDSLREARS
jgi:4-hydroxyphenylacetate 3-monooxygenase oxygenase component